MSALRRWLAPAVALGLVVGGIAWVFTLRLGSGEVYPLYSSLRADPLGTRVLYEALAQLPGMRLQRDFRPLYRLEARPRTVIIAGAWWRDWESVPVNQLRALRQAAQNGARVVIAFRADVKSDEAQLTPDEDAEETAAKPASAPPAPAKAKPEKEGGKVLKRKPKPSGRAEWEQKKLAEQWGLTLQQRWLFTEAPRAEREPRAAELLPENVEWHSDVYFGLGKDSPWRVLYRRAREPVLVEQAVGLGSIVLVADSFCLSNEAMHRARATGLVSWLVGGQRDVVFQEGALGVLAENGVGALARRYGLGGALALLVLLGALYAWRRLVEFVPRRVDEGPAGEALLAHDPAAGLTALLRRALRPGDVLGACAQEWQRSQRRGTAAAAARFAAAWQERNPKQGAAETYNALVRAVKTRQKPL